MKRIACIHTFEDKAFLARMMRMTAATLVIGAIAGVAWFVSGAPDMLGLPGSELASVLKGEDPRFPALPPTFWWFAAGAVGCFASLAVHELVHAIFFKAFAPAGTKITFGANWKAGMLYACAEDVVYTRGQYLAIALAPTFAVTLLLLALGVVSGWPVLAYIVAVLHLSGCTGDWSYVAAMLADARITHCIDRDWGVEFLGDGEPDQARGEDL